MAWVRLHDGALDHPKVGKMFDPRRPFDLWIWGMWYSQRHLTDGLIPTDVLPRDAEKAAGILVGKRLWEVHNVGWKVHDYLHWNDSRETIQAKRDGAKQRLLDHRKRVATPDKKRVSERVGNATSETPLARSGVVLRSSEEENEEALTERAGRLLGECYPAWYSRYRHGAKLRLMGNSLEFQDALSLVRIWDDARLEMLARIVLTTDDPFIAQTDRGFKIFALKASWADDRLKQAENGAA